MKNKFNKVLYTIGVLLTITGLCILLFLVGRKTIRMIRLQQLMDENIVIEIPDLHIKVPVLEGTDQKTLRKAAGYFSDTGKVGEGNFCIAGHSSVLYKEIFNELKNIESGMEIYLYDVQKHCYTYITEASFIIEPNELWILQDFGDDRITIVTCTDSGEKRMIVVGKLKYQ